jgi:PAS domain S-box-containing protein
VSINADSIYRRAFHDSSDAMAILRPNDGVLLDVNDSFALLTGYQPDELRGRSPTELGIIVGRGETDEVVAALRGDGSVSDLEVGVRTLSGETRLALLRTEILETESGPMVFCVVRDITERNRIAQELRKTEEHFRLITDNASDMISIHTPDTIVTYMSPSVRRLLGYEPEELVGRSVLDLVHPDDVPRVSRLLPGSPGVPDTFTVTHRALRKDGGLVWLESTTNPIRDPDTNLIVEVQTSARDVTERMQAEETLREAEERYRTLVERVPAIVYRAEFGEAGTWRFVSPQIESILGYSPEEWSGDPTLFDRRLHPDDVAKYRVDEERALKTGSLSAEFRMFRKDDQVAWIRDEARIYFGPSGEPVAMQGLMFDVTELEELVRTRSRLVQLLSHELFTPITSIQGAALTLLEIGEHLAPEDLQILAGGVKRAAARLRRLVLNLAAAARLDREGVTISTQAVSIGEVLSQAIDEFRSEHAAEEIVVSAPEGVMDLTMSADVDLAVRALAIVMENALAYSADEPVEVLVGRQDGGVRVEISDRGPGLPPSSEERVFEPFTQVDSSDTRPHEGLGIGLFLARRIMQVHGGEVTFTPRNGGGSTFRLDFRLDQ